MAADNDHGEASQPEPTDRGPLLERRQLLRSSALVAGAAAGAVALAARADVAHAADGENVVLGQGNESESTTALRIGGEDGTTAPTLSLTNADGPSLRLAPLPAGWTGELEVGEIAGTPAGPIIGVDLPGGVITTTYLVTAADLANTATPFTSNPSRRLDLRTTAGRSSVIRRSSPTALGSDGRLRAGQWIDVGIAHSGDDYELQAVFANLTVVGPLANGFVAVYPPGARPNISSVNFTKGQVIANFTITGLGLIQGWHALRIYTNADTWILLDVNGGINLGSSQAPLGKLMANRLKGGRKALADKLRTALTRNAVTRADR